MLYLIIGVMGYGWYVMEIASLFFAMGLFSGIAMGYKPNVELAEKTGLQMSSLKSISVDEYMRTSEPDVFAVGDCAERKHREF